MARIQLRRDTSTNWSTNNPTPLAGEPCFETDTGKLKIGDGSTAYNDLAYQGGGSAVNIATTDTAGIVKPDGTTITVTEDGTISSGSAYELPTASSTTLGGIKVSTGLSMNTPTGQLSIASTIPGQKTFPDGILVTGSARFTTGKIITVGTTVNSGYGCLAVKTGNYESSVRVGRNPSITSQYGIMTVAGTSGQEFGIFSSGYSDQKFRISGHNTITIAPAQSALTVSKDKLTFTKSDSTVVDLLAGGSGSGDVSAAGNNTFTGLNTFNEPIQLKSVQNTLKIETHSEQVDSEKVDFNCPTIASSTGDIYLNPIAMLELENSSGGTVTREGRIVNGSNGEVIPSINDDETSSTKTWSSKKLSKLSNLTLTDASNASMPSSNTSSFTIGASGTTYIAPSDGYIVARARFSSTPNSLELYSLNNSENTLLATKVERNQNGINEIYIPIASGMTFGYKYEGTLNTTNPFHTLYIVQTIGG